MADTAVEMVRKDMEKQGFSLTDDEYQDILEYTIRKAERCGKDQDYIPVLLENEIRDYFFRHTVTFESVLKMAIA